MHTSLDQNLTLPPSPHVHVHCMYPTIARVSPASGECIDWNLRMQNTGQAHNQCICSCLPSSPHPTPSFRYLVLVLGIGVWEPDVMSSKTWAPQLPYLLLELMLLFRKAAQEVWQEACVGAHVLVQKAVHTCNWFCSGSPFRRNRSSSPDNAHS